MSRISSIYSHFILLALLCCVFYTEASLRRLNLPCHFIDSIDISSGILQSNKSILFNGMEFPEDQYAEVNYVLRNGSKPIVVKPYFRGCPCHIKTCIQLCCPYGSFEESVQENGDIICRKYEAAKNIQSKILFENNRTEIVNLEQQFTFIDRLCKRQYFASEFQITDVNNFKSIKLKFLK